MIGKKIKYFIMIPILAVAMTACGLVNDNEDSGIEVVKVPNQQQDQTTAVVNTGPTETDTDSKIEGKDFRQVALLKQVAVTEVTASRFFEGKGQIDGFSDELKAAIDATYIYDDEYGMAGPGGHGYYNTLFGRVSPALYQEHTYKDGDGADDNLACPGFICIDQPEGVQDGGFFETVQPSINVVGRLDLNQLAYFEGDPVMTVSVFKDGDGGAISDTLVGPEGIEETENSDIGRFSVAVGLSGGGQFTIVLTAFRSLDGGAGNEPYPVMIRGFRVEAPEIELIDARPSNNKLVPEGEDPTSPIERDAIISSDKLDMRVLLKTAGFNDVQVLFENYDKDGHLQSVVSGKPNFEEAGVVYTGSVVLHQGANNIKIMARSPQFDELMGSDTETPAITFDVFNVGGGPKIKLISLDGKEEDVAVIAQSEASSRAIPLKFCVSFVPSSVEAGAGRAPSIGEDCLDSSLALHYRVENNGVLVKEGESVKGEMTANIQPEFGLNIYKIIVNDPSDDTESDDGNTTVYDQAVMSGSFIYGATNPLIENGELNGVDSFAPRGVNLDLDKSFIEGEIHKVLMDVLNTEETIDALKKSFKKEDIVNGFYCSEYNDQSDGDTHTPYSRGDTSIDFAPDFKIGPDHPSANNPAFEITSLRTMDADMLHVGIRVNGMHGSARMRAATANPDGDNFMPIFFKIEKLEVNLGVQFRKQGGVLKLDLVRVPGRSLFRIVGDGTNGREIYVDTSCDGISRSHCEEVEYFSRLDWSEELLPPAFNKTLNTTLLCGLEAGLNNAQKIGSLSNSSVELEKLINYKTPNPFRYPMEFDFFGNELSLDAAVNLLKSDGIEFDSQGVHLRGVPTRLNPGQKFLKDLPDVLKTGIIGSVSRWIANSESEVSKSVTNANHQLGLKISEDVINQTLFAASLAGLLDLDIDANFYTDRKIVPIRALSPTGDNELTKGIDLNQDGDISNDGDTPIQLSIRADKKRSPMLSFLTEAEVNKLAGLVNSEETPDPLGDVKKDVKYFRLALSGVELSVYKQLRQNVLKDYCEVPMTEEYNNYFTGKGFCGVGSANKAVFPLDALPEGVTECPSILSVPTRNGAIVSHGSLDAEGNPTPIYKVKADLILHGQFLGVARAVPAKDKFFTKPEDQVEKNLLNIRILPNAKSGAFVLGTQVLENHSDLSDSQVAENIEKVLSGAFLTSCSNLNQLLIPMPDRIPGDVDAEALLPDFDIDFIDLGSGAEGRTPQLYIDDSRLYLDLLSYVGIGSVE